MWRILSRNGDVSRQYIRAAWDLLVTQKNKEPRYFLILLSLYCQLSFSNTRDFKEVGIRMSINVIYSIAFGM